MVTNTYKQDLLIRPAFSFSLKQDYKKGINNWQYDTQWKHTWWQTWISDHKYKPVLLTWENNTYLWRVAFLVHMATHKHNEMAQARYVILKATQSTAFAKVPSALQANKALSRNSQLQKLSPTLEDHLICVGGRLKHSDLATQNFVPRIVTSLYCSPNITMMCNTKAVTWRKEQLGQQHYWFFEARHMWPTCALRQRGGLRVTCEA